MAPVHDALLSLRKSVATGSPVVLAKASDGSSTTENLAEATHVTFSTPTQHTLPLDEATRFTSSGEPVNLRSIILAWRNKDTVITDYVALAQQLNDETGRLKALGFLQKLDLNTWLEGGQDESENIKPLEGESARAAAQLASGASVGPILTEGKQIDSRTQDAYTVERRMGDRNTVLRGSKPMDFSYLKKYTELFTKDRKKPNGPTVAPVNTATLATRDKVARRRVDPIILLSPSASSLLRMSNIKSFLQDGKYVPPDSTSSANILHVSRALPSIDEQRPFRFILVDTPEQFKPDYWNRVVAVFTTGQTWQFKSYKWQNAPDLFKHALGIYVGWRGEDVPQTVRGWGRGVTSAHVDKWNPQVGSSVRWRDREVVEGVWDRIEESMRSRGWTKDGGPIEK